MGTIEAACGGGDDLAPGSGRRSSRLELTPITRDRDDSIATLTKDKEGFHQPISLARNVIRLKKIS